MILRLGARILLAAVFLFAGLSKVGDPQTFASQVAAYQVLPLQWVTLVAIALPWIELVCGLCLTLGFLTESSALVLAALSTSFGLAVASALARGLNLECGCFSLSMQLNWAHLALNLALLGLALLILRLGPGSASLDARWNLSS